MLFVTIYKNCSGAAFGRRIGNQVQILGEPVTVNEGLIIGSIARQRVRRDDPAMLHKPGDLPGQKKAASGVRRACILHVGKITSFLLPETGSVCSGFFIMIYSIRGKLQ